MAQAILPDLRYLTASAALEDLRQGRYTAKSLVEGCQARIDRLNPGLNALVALNREGARAAACQVDARRAAGEDPGLLGGLPISVKDAFATRDLPTTASHPPLATYQPGCDATVVARWRQAGAVLMGKSNLPELAGAPHGWSPLFGATHNPWQQHRTPGGSSSGAAVAIASGFSLLELGSDIGGSLRIPAAYCGIASLKATENRIPRTGHIPHLPPRDGRSGVGRTVWHLLSMGVLARSAADLALGYCLLPGPDGEDSTVPPWAPAAGASGALGVSYAPKTLSPASLRLLWWDDFEGLPLCFRTRAALVQLKQRLEGAGHRVERQEPGIFDIGRAWAAYGTLAGAEIGLGLPPWQRLLLGNLERLGPLAGLQRQPVARAFMRGLRADLKAYNQALNAREALIETLEGRLGEWDALLCPVAPIGPYPARAMPAGRPFPRLRVEEADGQGETRLPYLEATVAMTIPFSLTGHPVVVLPIGVVAGLPVGIQIIGRRWQEDTLLQLAVHLEPLCGGFTPPPDTMEAQP